MLKIGKKVIKIKYFNEKVRFLVFSACLLLCLFTSYFLLKRAYGAYYSSKSIRTNIDRAIYLIEAGNMSFNIDINQLVPRDEDYVYTFSIANYNDNVNSEIDISYSIELVTTTNLPIDFKLYRNEDNYLDSSAINLLGSSDLRQDEDGAWYKVFDTTNEYNLLYASPTADVYTFVANFPKSYSNEMSYANMGDNISVIIKSKQVV